jgi:hypothetical protein
MESDYYYYIHKSPPKVRILSQINPVHNMLRYFSEIHLNINILPTPISFQLSHQ